MTNTGQAANALAGNQRSLVTSIVYTFNQPVTLAANGTFTIAKTANISVGFGAANATAGTIPTLHWSNPSGDDETWVVTFSGNGVSGSGSVANGVYNITLNGADVTAAGSGANSLPANDTETFYRLAGDAAGYLANSNEAIMSGSDYVAAKNAFNLGPTPGQPAFKAYFDFAGAIASDEITGGDYVTLKAAFNAAATQNYSDFTPTI
jgi:hypothetical protein